VVDNHFDLIEDKTEWAGTTVTFEISEKDGRTEVCFTHQGLVPEYACFGACSAAWGFFVNDSLRSLITTGEGRPNRRDRSRVPAEEAGRGR
jgi:hypothetical protein